MRVGRPRAQVVGQLSEQSQLARDEAAHAVVTEKPASTCRWLSIALESLASAMAEKCGVDVQVQSAAGAVGRLRAQPVGQLSEQPELTRDEATHAVLIPQPASACRWPSVALESLAGATAKKCGADVQVQSAAGAVGPAARTGSRSAQ